MLTSGLESLGQKACFVSGVERCLFWEGVETFILTKIYLQSQNKNKSEGAEVVQSFYGQLVAEVRNQAEKKKTVFENRH